MFMNYRWQALVVGYRSNLIVYEEWREWTKILTSLAESHWVFDAATIFSYIFFIRFFFFRLLKFQSIHLFWRVWREEHKLRYVYLNFLTIVISSHTCFAMRCCCCILFIFSLCILTIYVFYIFPCRILFFYFWSNESNEVEKYGKKANLNSFT
jgi:hypothetical protein